VQSLGRSSAKQRAVSSRHGDADERAWPRSRRLWIGGAPRGPPVGSTDLPSRLWAKGPRALRVPSFRIEVSLDACNGYPRWLEACSPGTRSAIRSRRAQSIGGATRESTRGPVPWDSPTGRRAPWVTGSSRSSPGKEASHARRLPRRELRKARRQAQGRRPRREEWRSRIRAECRGGQPSAGSVRATEVGWPVKPNQAC
jgi:hypothetical protein